MSMGQLLDLSDERRAAKTWLPASDRDVTEGRVILREWEGRQYPACVKHGAMHRLTSQAALWRCGECGVGCEYTEAT